MKSSLLNFFGELPANRLAAFIFIPLVIAALFAYSDYGISWDEHSQIEIGTVNYEYVFHGNEHLLDYHDRDYGVAFELPLIILERMLPLKSTDEVYKMRHLASHLFFLMCLFFGFRLAHRLFNNQWIAAAGVLLFALHPVLYAHSFFNTKDIPFMGMYILCFYLIERVFSEQKTKHYILLGVAMALLVNMRVMGILLFLMVVTFVAVDWFRQAKTEKDRAVLLQKLMTLIVAFWFALYFSWPYLYHNTLSRFAETFGNMSSFRWNYEVLYFGELISATNLPWHYGLVWFAITTPIVYLIAGMVGIGLALYAFAKRPISVFEPDVKRHLLIYLISFAAPLVAVIVFKSVLYDGWRHLYFIYPPFVFLALYAFHRASKTKFRVAAAALAVLAFAGSGIFTVANHPNQQLFFNVLVNRAEKNHERQLFESDYWGVTYRQGYEAILREDTASTIKIKVANAAGIHGLDILSEKDRKRLVIDDENPDYFLTNYRWHPADYPYTNEIYRVEVQNNTVLSVFRLRE